MPLKQKKGAPLSPLTEQAGSAKPIANNRAALRGGGKI